MKAFLSYSHKDSWALERLHTHLAVLRREGKIMDWYDRAILPGEDIDDEIMLQLERCELFLPLVSPDFLNSNYCYEQEMGRAIERHAEGSTRVVPIIVEPCDWKSSPLNRFKALPRDGKPISDWTNQNTAFLDIVTELRRLLPADPAKEQTPTNSSGAAKEPATRDRQYRIKRDFDAVDKSDFRKTAFETIQRYFQSAIDEVNGIEGIKARFENIETHGFSCMVLNPARDRGIAHITVRTERQGTGFNDIYYCFQENAPPNTSNGGFNVVSDEYDLFLQPQNFSQPDNDGKISPERAAESLWVEFLERAGVSYD